MNLIFPFQLTYVQWGSSNMTENVLNILKKWKNLGGKSHPRIYRFICSIFLNKCITCNKRYCPKHHWHLLEHEMRIKTACILHSRLKLLVWCYKLSLADLRTRNSLTLVTILETNVKGHLIKYKWCAFSTLIHSLHFINYFKKL